MKLEINLRNFRKPYIFKGKETDYDITQSGKVYKKNSMKEPKSFITSNGDYQVNLYDKKTKRCYAQVIHRMVAETFIPNPANFDLVLHKDDDKSNNRIENLEWGTQSERAINAVRKNNMYKASGELSNLVKYSDKTIHKICKMIQDGYLNSEISKEVGVSNSYISSIRNREWRKDISEKYNWDIISLDNKRGSNTYNATIDENIARKICKMIQDGYKNKEISDKLNIPRYIIKNIRNRRNWKHVSKYFKW